MADRPGPGSWPIVVAVLVVAIATVFTEQVGSEIQPTASAAEESASAPAATHDAPSEEHAAGTPSGAPSDGPVVAPSPTESRSPTEDDFAAADLADQLAAALADGNIDILLDLLHPVVLETYSREDCVAHLEAVVPGIPPLGFARVTGTGTYEYATSNRTVAEVDDAVFVVLAFETASGREEEHSQFAWADGTLRWFTHCVPAA